MKKIILSLCLSSISLIGMSQKSQIDLPITWDDTANVDYTVIGFGSDTAYLAPDQTNASNIVLEVIKPIGAQTWAGVVLGNDSLASAIPFSAGNTIMRARIYAPVIGTPIRLKMENEGNAGIFVETQVNTTVAGWDTISFDFANQVPGTQAINFSNVYDKIAVFFNFGNTPTTANETYQIDYVEFAGGGSSGPSKAQIDLPINWDDTANVNYAVIDFGGNVSSLVVDPTNASNLVLKTDKPSTAQTWAGTTLGNSLATAIPFAASSTIMQARVWSAASGIPVLMKVEDQANAAIFVETLASTSRVGWDTLTFDFANPGPNAQALNFANTYNKVSLFFNFNVVPTATETYYTDDVWFGMGSTGPSKAQIDLPINWDDTANVDYTVIDFGGNGSSIVVDPTNASNIVLKTDKPTTAQTWAGTTLGNSLATAIPFAASSTIMQARIWSAASGIPVLMKVEDQTNAGIFVETLASTSRVGWDTLTFDFANPGPNTQALNFANTYDKVSLFFNFNVVPTATETYYTDDVWFGMGSAGPSKAQINLPINWDDTANVDYTVIDFGGNGSSIVVDPTNAANIVLKTDKPSSAQSWAGTTLGNSLATAIPFAASSTIMQARIWSAASGIPVLMKVEDQTNAGIFVETLASTSRVGWDTLTFDFANPGPNTQALNFANTYDKVSLFFNFNVVPTATETYYTDDVWFGMGSAGPSKAQIDLPINWDDTANVSYAVTVFGGNVSAVVTDPTNASNLVLQVDKPATAQSWAGTTLGSAALASAIPFAASNTVMQAKVWSAASGIPVLLKVEDQANSGIFVETLATTSKAGWDTLTFDFANPGPNTQALNFANTYDVVSIFFNFNVVPAATETYYLDNISFGSLITGIQEFKANPTFTVYPNPANDFVTIDASLLENINQVVVTNSIGQVVLQKSLSVLDNKIDVANFENGVYFMILNSESGSKTSKFMVAK